MYAFIGLDSPATYLYEKPPTAFEHFSALCIESFQNPAGNGQNICMVLQVIPRDRWLGFVLKNNVKKYYDTMPAEVKQFIRVACLESLGDASPLIRATVGILLSTLVQEDDG